MAVIHGRKLIIKVGGKAIAGAKSCEISIQGDQIEIASASHGAWRDFIAERKEWSVSCNHLIPNIGSPLKSNAAMINTTVTITIESGLTNDTLTGQAIVKSWKVTGTVGNLANGTFQFRGKGALT